MFKYTMNRSSVLCLIVIGLVKLSCVEACKDDVSSEWDASITIEDDRSVGDVVFTFPYNGGDPSGDDMHLCEDSAYFEINPRNRSEVIVKSCLPGDYTEVFKFSTAVGGLGYGILRINILRAMTLRRHTPLNVQVPVERNAKVVDVIDINKSIDQCTRLLPGCTVTCTNNKKRFWMRSGTSLVRTYLRRTDYGFVYKLKITCPVLDSSLIFSDTEDRRIYISAIFIAKRETKKVSIGLQYDTRHSSTQGETWILAITGKTLLRNGMSEKTVITAPQSYAKTRNNKNVHPNRTSRKKRRECIPLTDGTRNKRCSGGGILGQGLSQLITRSSISSPTTTTTQKAIIITPTTITPITTTTLSSAMTSSQLTKTYKPPSTTTNLKTTTTFTTPIPTTTSTPLALTTPSFTSTKPMTELSTPATTTPRPTTTLPMTTTTLPVATTSIPSTTTITQSPPPTTSIPKTYILITTTKIPSIITSSLRTTASVTTLPTANTTVLNSAATLSTSTIITETMAMPTTKITRQARSIPTTNLPSTTTSSLTTNTPISTIQTVTTTLSKTAPSPFSATTTTTAETKNLRRTKTTSQTTHLPTTNLSSTATSIVTTITSTSTIQTVTTPSKTAHTLPTTTTPTTKAATTSTPLTKTSRQAIPMSTINLPPKTTSSLTINTPTSALPKITPSKTTVMSMIREKNASTVFPTTTSSTGTKTPMTVSTSTITTRTPPSKSLAVLTNLKTVKTTKQTTSSTLTTTASATMTTYKTQSRGRKTIVVTTIPTTVPAITTITIEPTTAFTAAMPSTEPTNNITALTPTADQRTPFKPVSVSVLETMLVASQSTTNSIPTTFEEDQANYADFFYKPSNMVPVSVGAGVAILGLTVGIIQFLASKLKVPKPADGSFMDASEEGSTGNDPSHVSQDRASPSSITTLISNSGFRSSLTPVVVLRSKPQHKSIRRHPGKAIITDIQTKTNSNR